ncbi:MAG: pyridoxamine 5'-phosphate oxidase family protein [Candidatus Krumholzibacteriota bacterium]|nr:pyridoxamine 5'-phosphate oxidase family protein [Candidatus Krumholzibacteriota bacterium]
MFEAKREIINREEIDKIIRSSRVCRLAVATDNIPYIVPLSFGYDGEFLYFHTGKKGKKIDCFKRGPAVCFEFDHDVALAGDRKDPCKWTFTYKSVIGFGRVSELTLKEDKRYALNQIMLQYSGRKWEFEDARIAAVRIWKVSIDSVTGRDKSR